MKVEELAKGLADYQQLQPKMEAAEEAVRTAHLEAAKIVTTAEKQAETLLAKAKHDAQAATLAQHAQDKALAQREADVTTREKAVKWMKTKEQELAKREAALAEQQKALAKAESNALATKQHWEARSKELDAKAATLEQRILKLTEWEQRLRQHLPVKDFVNS